MKAIRMRMTAPGTSPARDIAYGIPINPAPRIEFVKFNTADPNFTRQTSSVRRHSAVNLNLDLSHRPDMMLETTEEAEEDNTAFDVVVETSRELEAKLLLEEEYNP